MHWVFPKHILVVHGIHLRKVDKLTHFSVKPCEVTSITAWLSFEQGTCICLCFWANVCGG